MENFILSIGEKAWKVGGAELVAEPAEIVQKMHFETLRELFEQNEQQDIADKCIILFQGFPF